VQAYKEPSPPRSAYDQFVLLPTTKCESRLTISASCIQNTKIDAFKDTHKFSKIVQSLKPHNMLSNASIFYRYVVIIAFESIFWVSLNDMVIKMDIK